ncbi:ATPase [Clostridium bovifaecis]|uniref:ATPase n=1 Tax=Clostridium bovifaecis TaxID=2184719 RepID=A0A6I6F4Z7_9CLOT|nr:ATPase [Clostridium bovifaecis]
MKVIKRDGEVENFEISKIKVSIMKASDDIDEPLNKGDISSIGDIVEEFIKKNYRDSIKSSEIHDIVVNILEKNAFKNIAKAYDRTYDKAIR